MRCPWSSSTCVGIASLDKSNQRCFLPLFAFEVSAWPLALCMGSSPAVPVPSDAVHPCRLMVPLRALRRPAGVSLWTSRSRSQAVSTTCLSEPALTLRPPSGYPHSIWVSPPSIRRRSRAARSTDDAPGVALTSLDAVLLEPRRILGEPVPLRMGSSSE